MSSFLSYLFDPIAKMWVTACEHCSGLPICTQIYSWSKLEPCLLAPSPDASVVLAAVAAAARVYPTEMFLQLYSFIICISCSPVLNGMPHMHSHNVVVPRPWRLGPVSGRQFLPWTRKGGNGLGMIQANYIYCVLISIIIITLSPPQIIRH